MYCITAEDYSMSCIVGVCMLANLKGDPLILKYRSVMLFHDYGSIQAISTVHLYKMKCICEQFPRDCNKLHFGQFSYEPFLCGIPSPKQVFTVY